MRLRGREYFWGFFSSLPRQDFYLTKADELNDYSFVLLFGLVHLFCTSTLHFEAAVLAIQSVMSLMSLTDLVLEGKQPLWRY